MSQVSVNGQSLSSAWVRAVNPGGLDHAKAVVSQRPDGYDTIGVRLADGSEKLILSQTAQALRASDKVVIDGQQATVVFVENERNTFMEGVRAAFAPKGSKIAAGAGGVVGGGVMGVAAYLFATIPVPMRVLSSTLVGGAVGALAGAGLIAGGIAAWGGFKGASVKQDNAVSDSAVGG